jgi:fermentation-respiration switch protein FrsA (DUF1100 family)
MSSPPPKPRRTPQSWPRIFYGLLRDLSIMYLLTTIVIACLQDRLIFRGHAIQGTPAALLAPKPGIELLTIPTSSGDRIAALFGPALTADGRLRTDAPHCPTILYFYGNDCAASGSWDQFDRFRRLGANVLLPDYLGYGMSTGAASEANIYATADAAYDYLLTRPNIDSTKIVPVGWSLGATAAIDLASRRSVAALITLGAFTSMDDMGDVYLPFFPVRSLLKHHFPNQRKLATVSCPTLLCHGRLDDLVPPAMAQRLASVASARHASISLLLLDTADHDHIFEAAPQTLYPALARFLAPLNPQASPSPEDEPAFEAQTASAKIPAASR